MTLRLKSHPLRLVNLKLITIENSKSLKRHAFLETLLNKLNTESIYYKHVLSFNIIGFADDDDALVERFYLGKQ
jgi:hypothetical protein